MIPPAGLLNIHKPAGVTSRQVVDEVVRCLRTGKVGHAGTLDPLATGVLVVCVGWMTRLVPYVQQQHKEYRARFVLGKTSDTDDITGAVVDQVVHQVPSRADLEQRLPEFTGTILQRPPTYSAIKVAGKRAYQLARDGVAVAPAARPVEVFELSLREYAFPEFELNMVCGSGTYVRSIGRDLGAALGCGAVMSELVRTRIGAFPLEQSLAFDSLSPETVTAGLLPARIAAAHLPVYHCTSEEVEHLQHGRKIPASEAAPPAQELIAMLTPAGELLAIGQHRAEQVCWHPLHVFPVAASVTEQPQGVEHGQSAEQNVVQRS